MVRRRGRVFPNPPSPKRSKASTRFALGLVTAEQVRHAALEGFSPGGVSLAGTHWLANAKELFEFVGKYVGRVHAIEEGRVNGTGFVAIQVKPNSQPFVAAIAPV